MAKKVVINYGWGQEDKFEAADAVRALAVAAGFDFSSTVSCGRKTIKAAAPAAFRVQVYRDGKPETYTDMAGVFPTRASFSLEDAFRALVKGLGMEFRAEYVVGSSKPVIVAVPVEKPKKAGSK